MFRTLFITTSLVLCCATAFGQPQEKNASEKHDKLRKDAVAFLRETLTDVNGMRSLENRISFAADLAGLMWFYDEREGRAMYVGVIGDFRELIAKYESQMNEMGVTLTDENPSRNRLPTFLIEPSDKSRLLKKFITAMAVRQQIAMSIAEHDADLAFSFYNDSLSSIANAELRSQARAHDEQFEFQLLGQLAETNPAKAVQYGLRADDKNVTFQHVALLKKIYEKDADKGAEYGSALLSRLTKNSSDSKDLYILSQLIEFGDEKLGESRKPRGRRPVFTQSEIRDLAEILAQTILARPDERGIPAAVEYIETIEKHLPGRAAQMRVKIKSAGITNSNSSGSNSNARWAAHLTANAANLAANANSGGVYEQEYAKHLDEEKKLYEDIQKVGKKELPKEQREKIIAQARKIIVQTPGRDKKILALSALAAQVASAGDKDLATEIMRDAERLVSPAPKTYQDFLLSWMLASGYASSDPDKAFPILEETIARANDTLAAFIKVGEFVDVAEEMIQDGEVQVGAFGGQMVRGLTSELGMADATIQVLANADFAKTKALTNRFERAEIRVLAKMMVLRAILDPKKTAKPDELLEGAPGEEES